VIHVIANLWTGGSSQLVVDLVERLGTRFEQEVIVRDLPPRPAYVGLRLHHRPRLRSPRTIRRLLHRLEPDLLHVHFLGHHGNAYSARDWAWYDWVFQAAESLGLRTIENVNVPIPPYVSPTVRRYVFVSDFIRARFGHRDCENETIYPGSDFQRFSNQSDATLVEGAVGMVYRLERDKLDESAVEVFLETLRRRPAQRALIVGGGRFLELYQAAAQAAGVADRIEFTGYVSYDDLAPLYGRMSVFVAPVHTESFGQVVPFAMGMGLPVAAYRVGALPEITGDDSILAPPGDVDALTSVVIGLLEDPDRRRRLGEANRERARQLFSVETMVARYETLYEEVLGQGSV
jgi:glycosyltransferase involved in cell wall biosynthesis